MNSRYNLGNNAYEKAATSEAKYKAKAFWMAVQFDESDFSIYFGSLSELGGKNAIPVDKCERGQLGSVWVHKKRHNFDFSFYSNS